jgi:hypothetical protein
VRGVGANNAQRLRVDAVAERLASKTWGGSWRAVRHAPVTGRKRLNGADSADSQPHIGTRGRADDAREAARGWRVRDRTSDRGYRIFPGLVDGTADAYGVSDMWFLRYHGNELEDGVAIVTGSASQTQIQIDKYLNGESINGSDVVVWYGGHFLHDEISPGPNVGHIVGPELRPFNWRRTS